MVVSAGSNSAEQPAEICEAPSLHCTPSIGDVRTRNIFGEVTRPVDGSGPRRVPHFKVDNDRIRGRISAESLADEIMIMHRAASSYFIFW